jgi:hypothetical protein
MKTDTESTYDKDFVLVPNPDRETLAETLLRDPSEHMGKFKLMDTEVASMYQTKTDEYERNYRRVIGFDWRTVFFMLSHAVGVAPRAKEVYEVLKERIWFLATGIPLPSMLDLRKVRLNGFSRDIRLENKKIDVPK